MSLCFILNKKILLAFFHCVKNVRIWSYSGPIFPTYPRIWTEYEEITQCFPLCNAESMPVLIEDKTLCGMGSFVASYFAFYYYSSRLSFILILTFYFTPRHPNVW